MEEKKCPFCGKPDTVLNPLLHVANGNVGEPTEACHECISEYDGTFTFDSELDEYRYL